MTLPAGEASPPGAQRRRLRVAFAGTPVFAERALRAILDAGFEVVRVLSQPDRPSGRGQKLKPSPVSALALERGLPLDRPQSLKDPAQAEGLRDCAPDVLVVAAFGQILPESVLAIPPHGCLNIHASLLPRWRGAAPIHRAIEAGDDETGVCIMQMEKGLDTGPVGFTLRQPIDARATTGSLHDSLAELGARAIVEVLKRIQQGESIAWQPQPSDGVTYAAKISREESLIDWTRPAREIARRIRAFDPAPGCWTTLPNADPAPGLAGGPPGEPVSLRLFSSGSVDTPGPRTSDPDSGVSPPAMEAPSGLVPETAGSAGRKELPGTVLAIVPEGVIVRCGEGALLVPEWQRAGARRLPAAAFLAGFALRPGVRLG